MLEKEALKNSLSVCEIVPAQLGEQIGDYGAVVAALDL
jgi:glucokinase